MLSRVLLLGAMACSQVVWAVPTTAAPSVNGTVAATPSSPSTPTPTAPPIYVTTPTVVNPASSLPSQAARTTASNPSNSPAHAVTPSSSIPTSTAQPISDIKKEPSAEIKALQQKHVQELAAQQKRLNLLEQANQNALAQNQALQVKNDNLVVQAEVLKSERSAQMFIYGAVTFGSGVFAGVVLYSIINSRRRRSW